MVLRDETTPIAISGSNRTGNQGAGARERREGGWVGAAVLFAVATVVALVLLGNDRPRFHAADELSLPEGKRMMVMAPLPRN